MYKQSIQKTVDSFRINILIIGFTFISALIVFKLFKIQVLDHKEYKAQAQEQYWEIQKLPAKRGDILSSDGYPLATTQSSYLLYIEPKKITDNYKVAHDLSQVLSKFNKLELEDPFSFYQNKLLSALEKDLYWVKVEDQLSPEQKDEILALNLEGIGFEEAPLRYYPENKLASHVLGFVAKNEDGSTQGYFGIEGSFNGTLQGKEGRIIEEKDALGEPILVGGYTRVDPIDGSTVELTINRAVEHIVEKKLQEGVEKYGAVSGSVIVMNPLNGDIIAMTNYPTYDPANFNDYEKGIDINEVGRKSIERRNLSISQTYEPGSVLKALTVSAAVDLELVTPNTTFVDAGPVRYSDYTIDNWDGKHHGVQTVIQLLQKSNNIGAAWTGHLVGSKNISKYFQDFGLGTPTGIELEGEDTGIIRPHDTWTDIDLATISFGQGISATPLQVLNAFNVIANSGELLQPRIVASLTESEKVIEIPKKVKKRVLKKETTETMIDMLTSAVDGGESKYFNLKNYMIAGKTGTAQIPVNGKYDPKKTNATFVGFLANSKKFSMIVKLEEPSSSVYAAETAVPLWMDITKELVKYYGIAPDKESVEVVNAVDQQLL